MMGGLLIALLAGAVVTFVATQWRHRRRMRLAFYAAGLERRLSKAQVRLLYDLAQRHRLRNPLLLLTSLKIFDRQVGRLAAETPPGSGTLDRFAAIRRRLGFDKPPVEQRFYTTRTLSPGQRLMVWPHGEEAGFILCVIVGRDERALSAVPLRRDDDRRLSLLGAGDKVKARLWRDGDTEYRFRTEILEVDDRTTTIRLRHAESLERVQLRDYYRARVDAPLTLFVLPKRVEEIAPETVPSRATARLEGTLLDLSGGGMSVQLPKPVPRLGEIVVDPDYDGPFPLGAAHLLLVDQTQRGQGWHVRLQFADLPESVRDDLVAAVFDHEVMASR